MTTRAILLTLLTAGVGSFYSATPLSSQESPGQQANAPAFRTNVRQVLVPVVVTDQKGRYVADLKAADFKVYEDGVPQEIVAFSTAAGPAASDLLKAGPIFPDPSQPLRSDSSQARRTYLICVDTLHSAFGNFSAVRDALGKVLAHENADASQYALITLGRALNVVQQPTGDASEIAKAARSSIFAKAIRDSEASSTAILAGKFKVLMQGYCTGCACRINGKSADDGTTCSSYKGRVQLALVSVGEQTSLVTQGFLAQLQQTVRAAAALPGARTIILISDGFSRYPGRELYAIMQGFGPKDQSLRFNPLDTGPELEKVVRLATEYNVTFYTIDSRGLYTGASMPASGADASTPSSAHTQMDARGASPQSIETGSQAADRELLASARENTDGMAALARATGGIFFENSNDLAKGIRTALADGREYYLLATCRRTARPTGSTDP